MAFLVIELDIPSESVAQLNDQLPVSGNALEGVVVLRNMLDALLAGAKDGSAACAVRSTSAAVSASGGGESPTYDLK